MKRRKGLKRPGTIAGLKGKNPSDFHRSGGGFDETEVEAAMAAGALPVTLGKRILRTETAGLAMLSVLMFEFEEE
ncbi:MAG: 16S rRNA (uracil(1498)-N(3))-methyltransferase [Frisingicoccus sp.]